MGFFKELVNTLVVTPTKRVTEATIEGAKAVVNVVKAGGQAVSGNGSKAKETLKKAEKQYNSSVKKSIQYNDIVRAKENPKIVTAVGTAMTVVGGVLTATGYGAAVGAPLMAAGAKVTAVGGAMSAAKNVKQGVKEKDVTQVVEGVGQGLSAVNNGTGGKNETLSQVSTTYNHAVKTGKNLVNTYNDIQNTFEDTQEVAENVYNKSSDLFTASPDKTRTESASPSVQYEVEQNSAELLTEYEQSTFLDRALIWLFGL